MGVCVCVCGREREPEKERGKERDQVSAWLLSYQVHTRRNLQISYGIRHQHNCTLMLKEASAE